MQEVEDAARSIRQPLRTLKARGEEQELRQAFAGLAEQRIGGLLVGNDSSYLAKREQLVSLAKSYSVPAIYEWRAFPLIGGLMSYGPSLMEDYRQLAVYAARILNGTRPADLPVQQPTQFELVLNATTAKELGLTIPQSILVRADEVIE